tara:strand:- start:411 stop:1688 length:1278 start_codon:yes stop_codon:yes gene_type:complete
MSKLRTVRGMQDILPSQVGLWQFFEKNVRRVFSAYGYDEIRFPIVEFTELFDRSIGEGTDIVTKEMYTFLDRGGESLSLRPEGTAGCLRACLNNDLIRTESPRLWYMGPMFRYERPQKGRFRQFHQASVEAFGVRGPHIDAEMILMTARLWKALGVEKDLKLEVNSLGSNESRKDYIYYLMEYIEDNKSSIGKEIIDRSKKNPLRILDSKSPKIKDILLDAPKIYDYLDADSKDHFHKFLELLDQNSIKYSINHQLVRGLDYYNRTVFEWKSDSLGSQDAICGGGRYDKLVQQLSGKDISAVGFSIGIERLILLLDEVINSDSASDHNLDGYFICLSDESFAVAQGLAEEIRSSLPSFNLKIHYGDEKISTLLKRADKEGAKIALILGEEEINNKKISIKDLRRSSPQMKISFTEISKELTNFIK